LGPGGAAPGSQQALALRNREIVLAGLLAAGPATQAALARSTGLSAATVSNVVSRLRREGRVRTDYTVSHGRRAVLVQLQEGRPLAAGFEVSSGLLHAVLLRPGGQIVARASVPASGLQTGAGLSEAVADSLRILLAEVGAEEGSLGAASVALPRPPVPGAGPVTGGIAFRGCSGGAIQAVIQEALGVPVTVAAAPAMAAFAHSRHLQATDGAVLFLSAGSEVTAGIVLGGQPYTGHAGLAGQIGHIRVSDQGLPCRCGNRGCLDTIASVPAVLAAYATAHAPVTFREFAAFAVAGDPAALRIAEAAAEALGRAAAGAANIINPRHIVLSGPLGALGALLLDPFRRSLVKEAGPGIGDAAVVSLNALGPDAAAVGAALYAARAITTF
jgi:predicted NBD/HSP70 family sugar kinase